MIQKLQKKKNEKENYPNIQFCQKISAKKLYRIELFGKCISETTASHPVVFRLI